jgi:hypothetical protein
MQVRADREWGQVNALRLETELYHAGSSFRDLGLAAASVQPSQP